MTGAAFEKSASRDVAAPATSTLLFEGPCTGERELAVRLIENFLESDRYDSNRARLQIDRTDNPSIRVLENGNLTDEKVCTEMYRKNPSPEHGLMDDYYYEVDNYYVIARIARFENPDGTFNLSDHGLVVFDTDIEIIGASFVSILRN